MSIPRIIVCERSEKWAVALRRCLNARYQPQVLETRSLGGCWQEVAANPTGFVAVECLVTNLDDVARWLKRLSGGFPRTRAAVLSDRGQEPTQWLLREVGAVHVVFSPRELEPLVQIIQRHIALVPAEEKPVRQRLWERLPWG